MCDRCDISDTQMLVYLQHALKDGSARSAIERLSRSGEHYAEAIKCLESRYDRLCLIHQMHVRKIAPLKDGNGKELRRLHDVLQQHLRALKSMDHEPSGSFITSMIELKLDQSTMFEWQKFSQKFTDDVPHYNDLLEFLNLCAQACVTCTLDTRRTPRRKEPLKQLPARQQSGSKDQNMMSSFSGTHLCSCLYLKTYIYMLDALHALCMVSVTRLNCLQSTSHGNILERNEEQMLI